MEKSPITPTREPTRVRCEVCREAPASIDAWVFGEFHTYCQHCWEWREEQMIKEFQSLTAREGK